MIFRTYYAVIIFIIYIFIRSVKAFLAHGSFIRKYRYSVIIYYGGSSGSTGSDSGYGGFSNSEIDLLARIISAESRGEPYEGQVAVAAVILNRIEHPSFPNTLSGVIYQPGAFSCLTDGGVNAAVADSAYKAARDAINGSDPSGGAIYYYNPAKSTNKWILSRPVITVIGGHRFCS